MEDEMVVADSAGHIMIDIEAIRAADRAAEAPPEKLGEGTGSDRPRVGAKAPAPDSDRRGGRALPVLAHGRS